MIIAILLKTKSQDYNDAETGAKSKERLASVIQMVSSLHSVSQLNLQVNQRQFHYTFLCMYL